jgi:hypothetical protein
VRTGPQDLPAALGREQQIQRLGVVTRMCGGVRTIAARSDAVVSPVRTAAVMRGYLQPSLPRQAADAAARLGQVLVDVGAQGLQRRDVDHADFVRQRRFEPSRVSSSMAERNAARVLPDPVGAAMSVCLPSRIEVQPPALARQSGDRASR